MEKMAYNISSRAAILLGRESVAKSESALIELVKNTFDADAKQCFIEFDIENDSIYIIDNGSGMTLNDVKNKWMLIGTENKNTEFKSDKGRIRSGAKGIGRFALDKLGGKCEVITKSENADTIHWKNDWSMFEKPNQLIGDVKAEFEVFKDKKLHSYLPTKFSAFLETYESLNMNKKPIEFESGTIIRIYNLREKWTENKLEIIRDSIERSIPRVLKDDLFEVYFKSTRSGTYRILENVFLNQYDYKVECSFTGTLFNVTILRNEYEIEKFDNDFFEIENIKKKKITRGNLAGPIEIEYKIEELLKNNDEELLEEVKKIGKFKFDYQFARLSSYDKFDRLYNMKPAGRHREKWMKENSGIRIYRDGFLVRPYGTRESGSFDWLNLDARKASSPASFSHESESWKTRNNQLFGVVQLSRVENSLLSDKSNREGLIENEYFALLKNTIVSLISIFEGDRAFLGKTIAEHKKIMQDNERVKRNAKKILSDSKSKSKSESKVFDSSEGRETISEAFKVYEQEAEELITEIKLLRTLATNGLISTSVVHDLKTLDTVLVSRVENLKDFINMKDEEEIQISLETLHESDEFMKAWIKVLVSQDSDKRKRKKQSLSGTIMNGINRISPILKVKKTKIKFHENLSNVQIRLFESDFESIILNLIINSIESLESSNVQSREIEIILDEDPNNYLIQYSDNGKGIDPMFKDPYEILKYGTTSKTIKKDKRKGTGLGMYIVESTIREYDGKVIIDEYVNQFKITLVLPKKGNSR